MKRLSNLLAALVFASLVIFMSCGGGGDDPAPSAGETQGALLERTWVVSSAPRFGTGIEGDWGIGDNAQNQPFRLTINQVAEGANGVWGGRYTATNVPTGYEAVWPTSGAWAFESATVVNRAVRSDASQDVTVGISVSDTQLTLTFTLIDPAARTSGIFGSEWTFQFTPQ